MERVLDAAGDGGVHVLVLANRVGGQELSHRLRGESGVKTPNRTRPSRDCSHLGHETEQRRVEDKIAKVAGTDVADNLAVHTQHRDGAQRLCGQGEAGKNEID